MLQVMAIIENDGKSPGLLSAAPIPAARSKPARISMRFEMPGEDVD